MHRTVEVYVGVTDTDDKPLTEAAVARRTAIMNAAFAVFVEKGFEASTTLEIVQRAKTSKRALYETFASKDEILTALIRETSERMKAPPDLPWPLNRTEFLVTLRHFGERFLTEYLHPHRIAMHRLAIAEAGRGGGSVARELDASGRLPVVQSLRRYFGQAAEQGLLAPGDIAQLMPPVTPEVIKAKAAAAIEVLDRLMGKPA
jgi:AcrR family transcriptional regulator